VRSCFVSVLLFVACDNSVTRPDAGAPSDAGRPECVPEPIEKIDVLLMIDSSNDMAEPQALFFEQFERVTRVLTSGDLDPGRDADGDGAPNDSGDDFTPISDIQVGVVTADMGSGGFAVMSCSDEPAFGDDGVLRSSGNTTMAGCSASYPRIQRFDPGDDVEAFSLDVSCIGKLGTGGCGLEQPLESVLKALIPSSCTGAAHCEFAMGTRGHGDGENGGFVRPDSLLAIVLLTDENDISAADADLFDLASTRYEGQLDLRGYLHPDALHPIERYRDGLLALRPGSPERLFFAALAGLPPDLSTETSSLDDILAAPEMHENLDPTMPLRFVPSCNVPGFGISYPPRRVVEVARELEASGAHGFAGSLCLTDYTEPVSAMLRELGGVIAARGCTD
jgi:hypothetical protein